MSSRKQISAIDVVISLVHDIQLVKHDNEDTLVLFIDVKKVFNHVSINQLQKVYQNLGLPRFLYRWIECFINNKHLQLVFNDNK